MNIGELLGVIYIAVKAGGSSSKNAYIALGAVVVWILLGFVWVAVNPSKGHARKVVEERQQPSMIGV
jgi:hypothetical protein